MKKLFFLNIMIQQKLGENLMNFIQFINAIEEILFNQKIIKQNINNKSSAELFTLLQSLICFNNF